MLDKSLDDWFVIFGILTSEAIGDNGAYGRRLVTEKEGETVDARTLHLVISDAATIVAECVDPLIEIRRGEREAHYPTLRAIEARGGNRGADMDAGIVTKSVDQLRRAVDDVWLCEKGVPIDMSLEGMLEIEVGNLVAPCVVVEDTVKTDGSLRKEPRIDREIGLERARSTDANYLECGMFVFRGAGLEIYIDKGIQLGHDNVDIVGADTCGENGNAFALIGAGEADELTICVLALDGVEELLNHRDTTRIANEDDFIGELSGLDMEMENRAVGIDDELRIGNRGFIHCKLIFLTTGDVKIAILGEKEKSQSEKKPHFRAWLEDF